MTKNVYANDNGSVDVQPGKPAGSPPRRARRWWVLLAIPLAAGALWASAARAHGFGGPGEGRMGAFMQERMDHLLTAAGASDAQKAQIKAIWEPLRPQLKGLHQQQGDLHRQLGEAVAASTIDTARVEQLRRQSVQTMDKISALMTQGMVASAQALTPDQRKLVLQKMREHRGHHGPDDQD